MVDGRRGRTCPKGKNCHAYKHGFATDQNGKSPEYRTWRAMKSRCLNKKDPAYPRYGGRGIKIHQPWVDNFLAFLTDMGQRPDGKSLDRIDVNGDYTPDNCRWATRREQGANMRSNHLITIDGDAQPLIVWAERYKLDPGTITYRIRNFGWSPEKAVTTPKLRNRSNKYA